MRKPKGKFTLVSFWHNGKTISAFIHLPYRDGKPVMSIKTMDMMLRELGCKDRGVTFSVG